MKIPVKNKYNWNWDDCEEPEEVFGEYMYHQMMLPPIDLDSLNETVERKMQLMEM